MSLEVVSTLEADFCILAVGKRAEEWPSGTMLSIDMAAKVLVEGKAHVTMQTIVQTSMCSRVAPDTTQLSLGKRLLRTDLTAADVRS